MNLGLEDGNYSKTLCSWRTRGAHRAQASQGVCQSISTSPMSVLLVLRRLMLWEERGPRDLHGKLGIDSQAY